MQMTAEQLKQHIRDAVVPMLKEHAGALIADVVREQIETSLKPLREKQETLGSVESLIARWSGHATPTPEIKPLDKGLGFGQALRAIAFAKLNGGGMDLAMTWAKKNAHPVVYAAMDEARTKAMAASDGTGGGFLVPIQFSQDIIEFLRPQSYMRALNPMLVPMPTGTVRIPKITAGSAASYIGENTNISNTAPVFGQIVLSWKKLAAIVPISNDLIRFSSPAADSIVRDDVVRAMAQRENQAFLRDDGTANTPKGLRNWIAAANVLVSAGTTLANMTTDLGAMILALLNANVPMTRPAWIMSPRSWNSLNTIQTTTGAFAYRPELMTGTLLGYPFQRTTQVPGSSTTGELYLADMADVVIGDSMNLMVDSSQEAAYHDGSQVVAAFSQDQTVVRVISEHDFALRRDVAAAVMTTMSW